MLFENMFLEVTAILVISAVIGALATQLRQPLIVAFIGVGVLVGPAGLDMVSAHEQIELLAELGIALLLFVVGLKLDLHLIRTTGPVALATGMGQVLFTSVFGFLIALGFGIGTVEALYLAVGLTFSSTIIIVKLLSDKREIDALHGRIALGFLIVQDVAAVLALIGLTALGAAPGEGDLVREGLRVVAVGLGFLGAVGLLMRYVLPPLLDRIARSPELLVLSAIAWAVLLAALGDTLGFSKEVGAFLAGISLASTPYREAIASRLVSLRDFLLLFFFIDLGAGLDLSLLGAQVGPAAVFSVFVLVGNPLIVMGIMGFMGYRKRTGFLAGLTVAQISEFSLILGAMGVSLGHLSDEAMGLLTLVGLVTIGLSTYLILYSHPIYHRLSPALGLFERRIPHREHAEDSLGDAGSEVILFGLGRYGRSIAKNLRRVGKRVLGVDFDPQAVVECQAEGLAVRYGDAEDPDILEHLPLAQARWVVSAAPGREANLTLLRSLRAHGYRGKVVLTAHSKDEVAFFQKVGADKVLFPFEDAAEQAVDALGGAAERIHEEHPWGVTLAEVRVTSDSLAAGRRLRELALRSRTGASVIAVDRGGRSLFDLGPEFQIFPRDRLVLVGPEQALDRAREMLQTPAFEEAEPVPFRIGEIAVGKSSPWAGRSLEDIDLRGLHGLNVIGIQRGDQRITAPDPGEVIRPGDRLVVAGAMRDLEGLCGGGNACGRLGDIP
ncbi:MAG: cation:proton antiporter [Deferrisomatales bacterium]|nr:cation:proton antiporter [Deferrisomatales bacterium]